MASNKTLNNVTIKPTFVVAEARANLESGENLTTSLGKIMKWYNDLSATAWSGNAATVNGHSVNKDVPANAVFTDTTYTFSEGSIDGKFAVSVNGGTATPVTIHGLGSSAYKAESFFIAASLKGANNGVAELDATGKVPSAQLPSYVDDVIEGYYYNSKFYNDSAHTSEITPETSKIYVDLVSNKQYRWGGTAYVIISESLALGTTSSTAYRGDYGNTAYLHSQNTSGNPHGVTAAMLGITDMIGATSSQAGTHGLVPAPPTSATGKFLRGDGTWQAPTFSVPTASATTLGGIKVGTNLSIAADGTLSATDTLYTGTNPIVVNASTHVITHSSSAGFKHIPTGGAADQYLKYSESGTAVWSSEPIIPTDTLTLNCV